TTRPARWWARKRARRTAAMSPATSISACATTTTRWTPARRTPARHETVSSDAGRCHAVVTRALNKLGYTSGRQGSDGDAVAESEATMVRWSHVASAAAWAVVVLANASACSSDGGGANGSGGNTTCRKVCVDRCNAAAACPGVTVPSTCADD